MSEDSPKPQSESPVPPPPAPSAPGAPSAPPPAPSAPSVNLTPPVPTAAPPKPPLDMTGQMTAPAPGNLPSAAAYPNQAQTYGTTQPLTYQGGVPGQPMPAISPTHAPAPSSGFDTNAELLSIWQAFKNIFSGKTVAAFAQMERGRFSAYIVLGLLALLGGLFLATSMSHTGALGDSVLDGMSSSFGLSTSGTIGMTWGAWFKVFILMSLTGAVVLAMRCLAVLFSAKLAAGFLTYLQAMRIVATAFVPAIVILLPLWLLYALPLGTLSALVMMLVMLIAPMCIYLAEIIIYVGINRAGNCARSPLIPHVVLTGVINFIGGFLFFATLLSVAPSWSDFI